MSNKQKDVRKKRKRGLWEINLNKEGSVRDSNGKLIVDFILYGHRVREPAGLITTKENARHVRGQLDLIIISRDASTFEFRKVFPNSKKVEFLSTLERKLHNRKRQPDEVLIKDFIWEWYDLLRASGRVTERTLLGYKRQLELYIQTS
jgi:integrase